MGESDMTTTDHTLTPDDDLDRATTTAVIALGRSAEGMGIANQIIANPNATLEDLRLAERMVTQHLHDRAALDRIEAENVYRREKAARWDVWTLGHRAWMVELWHIQDIAITEGRAPPEHQRWRPGGIGTGTVAALYGGPPPKAFGSPETGGSVPLASSGVIAQIDLLPEAAENV